ncbi:MAG TPA: FG-GAP-like repeat-containing protein [Cyclobacteriaceae bacterium]
MRLAGMLIVVVFSLTISCTTKEKKEEILAHQYCGTCHAYPEPSLLSKNSWATVMPQMALRMGLDISTLLRLPEDDYAYVINTLPQNPMISEADFESIANYYERESPDSLALPPDFPAKELRQFSVTSMNLLGERPTITMVRADTVRKQLWLSNRGLHLYKYDYNFKLLESRPISSPASSIVFTDNDPLVALMGIMDPNDQPKGSVVTVRKDSLHELVNSIKRPVHLQYADLNNDTRKDIIACAFGNFTGTLSVYEATEEGKYIGHTISSLPGARKTIVKDFNGDGMPDILALFTQGDEQISLFTNAGNFRFRVTTLLRFPPVYGSAVFDIVDFNKDGHWDIVYANGDNADYSKELKPYHGIRVFLNDGTDHFKESIFQQVYGCFDFIARDFDKDGDIDIAANAFFPNFEKTPERGFVYFENNNGKFEPQVTPIAAGGRWLLTETVDVDNDGYLDVILAALNFDTGVPTDLDRKWDENPMDILVLKNLSRSIQDQGKK